MPPLIITSVLRQGCLPLMHPRRALIVAGRRYATSGSNSTPPAAPVPLQWDSFFSTTAPTHATTLEAGGEVMLPSPDASPTQVKPKGPGRPPSTKSNPDVNIRDLLSLARHRPLEELLPLLSSLISDQKLELADALYNFLPQCHTEEWKAFSKTHIINQFLDAHIERNDWIGTLKWKDQLFSGDLKTCAPNVHSFALLLRFCLKCHTSGIVKEPKLIVEEVRRLIQEAAVFGLSPADIIETQMLTPAEVTRLTSLVGELASSIGNRNGNGNRDHDKVEQTSMDVSSLALEMENEMKMKEGETPVVPLREALRKLPESKSMGISYIKESLRVLSTEGIDEVGRNLYTLQEALERDCISASVKRLFEEVKKYQQATKAERLPNNVMSILADWLPILVAHIKKSIHNVHEMKVREKNVNVRENSGLLYASMLRMIPPENIALVVLQELCRLSNYDPISQSIPFTRLSNYIGSALEREFFVAQASKKQFLKHTRLNPIKLSRILQSRRAFDTTMRKTFGAMERNEDAIREGWIPRWGLKLKPEIGSYCASLAISILQFINARTVDGPVKAFEHKIIMRECKQLGVCVMQKDLFEMMSSDKTGLFAQPLAMPMLVPPKPWLTFNSGGYLHQRIDCVRLKDDPVHLAIIHAADRNGELEPIYRGLDALGQTAWMVNEPVLRTALHLWNSGIDVTTMEPAKKPEDRLPYKKLDEFASKDEYHDYCHQVMETLNKITTSHSNMCDVNYKLEIARQFSGLPFYLPHSVDFRGRAYPIPPHLSHIGSDLSRGLLMFHEGHALGKDGLRWLKIQLSNSAGFDKASFAERVAYAEKHMAQVMASADNPLDPQAWWRTTDSPWQCLAACFELTAAMRHPNPEEFVSRLPVQQDGSCNGLQHYAALGRDIQGAQQVNLSPSERPQDLYSAVARLVIARIEKDALDPSHPVAAKLVGKINRKVVKQTVMTNVYGVTRYGARTQIGERLREFNIVNNDQVVPASSYLANIVFDSLGTLFEKASLIQKWLTDTAMEISRAVPKDVAMRFGTAIKSKSKDKESEPEEPPLIEASDVPMGVRRREKPNPIYRYPQTSVYWTTPLGYKVLQPYVKTKAQRVQTVMQSLNLKIVNAFDPVDALKQASAFPPNFIHSLDATHMFRTALACREANISFASVHDCFWTHAATVQSMNRILREQFVALHSAPVLENMRQEFITRYRDYVVPENPKRSKEAGPTGDIRHIYVDVWRPIRIAPLPPTGDFNLQQVLQSDYFFS